MKYDFKVYVSDPTRYISVSDVLKRLKAGSKEFQKCMELETKHLHTDREALLYAMAISSGYDSIEELLNEYPDYNKDSNGELTKSLTFPDEDNDVPVVLNIEREDGEVIFDIFRDGDFN